MRYIVWIFLGLALVTNVWARSVHKPAPPAHPKKAQASLAILERNKVIVVIDLGHGDPGTKGTRCFADPGCQAQTATGIARECVFTRDVGVRLKRQIEAVGGRVIFTQSLTGTDLIPQSWNSQRFPRVPNDRRAYPKQPSFTFRRLTAVPYPQTSRQALNARVASANAIYRRYHKEWDIYFFSLHFDSNHPNLAGVSYYYSPDRREVTRFGDHLERQLKKYRLGRINQATGQHYRVGEAKGYNVLSHAINADAYLIELGNTQNATDRKRLFSPWWRQRYAQLITAALTDYVRWKEHFVYRKT